VVDVRYSKTGRVVVRGRVRGRFEKSAPVDRRTRVAIAAFGVLPRFAFVFCKQ